MESIELSSPDRLQVRDQLESPELKAWKLKQDEKIANITDWFDDLDIVKQGFDEVLVVLLFEI